MAITTQLVGKLGGGKVEKIDVNFVNPSSNGTYDVVTVPIPEGVPHLVVLKMKTMEATGTINGFSPKILFDTADKGYYSNSLSTFSAGGVHSSTMVIKAQRNGGTSPSSAGFTGTVYYCPIEN